MMKEMARTGDSMVGDIFTVFLLGLEAVLALIGLVSRR